MSGTETLLQSNNTSKIQNNTTKRITEIDFLKSVYIILMVIFHLVYFADKHLYAKQIVYTFHMPAFLLISGYFSSTQKSWGALAKSMLWLFIPYAVMETAYICAASFMPVREAVGGELSPSLILMKIFWQPMGPYWYLHTLIVCNVVSYAVFKLTATRNSLPLLNNNLSRLICIGLIYWLLSSYTGMWLDWINGMYFLAGVGIKTSGKDFRNLFRPSLLAIIPFILFCMNESDLSRNTLQGVVMTVLSICILLWIHGTLPAGIRNFFHRIGRNTLPILLFSPAFTMLSKKLVPYLSWDEGGYVFMIVATVITIAGSIGIAYLADKMRLSPYLFGKKQIIQ